MNDAPNPIREKSYSFAVDVARFCRELIEKKEYVLSRQLLKSGTSIGANIEEGLAAPSKKDFANKLSISLKEAFESRYWLRILHDSGFATTEEIDPFLKRINEIIAILMAILKTTRVSLKS